MTGKPLLSVLLIALFFGTAWGHGPANGRPASAFAGRSTGQPVINAPKIPERQRYLAIVVYQYEVDPAIDDERIENAARNGCNAAEIAVHWDKVYPTPNSAPNWRVVDSHVNTAIRMGMKVAIRIHTTREPASLNGFYGDSEVMQAADGSRMSFGDGKQYSFAHQSTLEAVKNFVRQVAQRYQYLQNQDNLLFMSAVASPIQEGEYSPRNGRSDGSSYAIPFDYSEPMKAGFRQWLQGRYGLSDLNRRWGSDFSSWDAVSPPNYNSYDVYNSYNQGNQGTWGQDWYVFRHIMLKRFLDETNRTIKEVNGAIQVVNQHGSVWDSQSNLRGTMGFKNLAQNADGIKINDSPGYNYRLSMDLLRSNLRNGAWVCNEVDGLFYGQANFEDFYQQIAYSFDHGARLVTLANFGAPNARETLNRLIQRTVSQGYLSQPVPQIQPATNMTYKLSSIVVPDYNNWDGRIGERWSQLYNQNGNKPVQVTLIEDWLEDNANQNPRVNQVIPNQTAYLNNSFQFAIPANTFTDPDGSISKVEITGGLPALGLSANGTNISGTPTSTGSITVTVKATDNKNASVTTQFQISVQGQNTNQPPVVAQTVPDQTITAGQPYLYIIPNSTFSDPDGSIAKINAAGLPPGLSYDLMTHALSGNPTTAGTSTITLTATDDKGSTVQTSFKLTINSSTSNNQLPIVARAIPDQTATVGQGFNYVIPQNTFSDPDGQISKIEVSGLTSGLSFDGNERAIKGTPATAGVITITATATDNQGATVSTTFKLTINNSSSSDQLTMLEPLFDCGNGRITFRTSGGDGSKVEFKAVGITNNWTATSAFTIDPWLCNGVTFEIQARQSGKEIKYNYTTPCTDYFTPVVAQALADQTATVGQGFRLTIPLETFKAFTSIKITVSTLPNGLSYDQQTRTISGTPTKAGTSTITVTATDDRGATAKDNFKLTIKAADTPPTNPTPLVGTPEGFMESASCANVVGWAWDNGQPNASIALELLDGTTAESATVVATTQANIFRQDLQDAGKGNGAHGFIFSLPASVLNGQPHVLWVRAQGSTYLLNWSGKTITCAGTGGGTTTPPTSSTVNLADQTATVGQAYSYAVSNIPSGSTVAVSGLPAGLSYNSQANTISGTPTTATTASVNIKVTDSKSNVTTYIYKLTVKAADTTTPTDPTSNTVTMADQTATVGQSYVYVFPNPGAGSKVEVSGLPAGIGFDAMTYGIGGVPTTATVASISIKVTDPKGSVTTYGYKLTVKNADGSSPTTPTTPSSSTVNLAEQTATVGQAYSYAVSNISSGSTVAVTGLPAGLSYNTASKTIAGTPTTATTASVSIKVTDSKSNVTTYIYKLIVKTKDTPPTNPTPIVGTPEGFMESASCANVVGWAWDNGQPNASIALELLDGTTAESATVVATTQANIFRQDLQDAGKGNGAHGFIFSLPASVLNGQPHVLWVRAQGSTYLLNWSGKTITCAGTGGGTTTPPTSSTVTLSDQTATVGQAYSYAVSNIPSGSTVAVSGLPAGLSYNSQANTISGTPTTATTASISIKVTDSKSNVTTYIYKLTVKAADTTTPTDPTSNTVTMADQTATVGQSYVYVFPNPGAGSKVEVSGLPAGIGFDAMTYGIGGVPTTATVASISIKVTDPKGSVTTYGYKLTVKNADGSSPTTPTTPSSSTVNLAEQTATVGQAYSYAVSNSPSGSSVSVSGLPAGLSYNSTSKTIAGTPTAATTASVSIKVTDSKSNVTTYVYKLTVKAADTTPNTPSNPIALVGTPEGFMESASCANVVGWAWDNGQPNASIALELLDGTTAESATVVATTQANIFRQDLQDAGKGNGAHGFIFSLPASVLNGQPHVLWVRAQGSTYLLNWSGKTITCAGTGGGTTTPPTSSTVNLADQTATVGQAYSYAVSNIPSGSTVAVSGLPAGLSYNSQANTISGTPTTATTASISIKVTDSKSNVTTYIYKLTVKAGETTTPTDPTSNTVTMADQTATVGQSYVYVFPNPGAGSKVEVSGLPAGIGFDAMTYGIGGVPTTATVASISIKVTDPKGNVTTYIYKLTVKNADGSSPTTPTTPSSSTVNLAEQTATVGQAYSYAVSNIPSGSSVSVSGLPAGLSYNTASKTIAGTPTTATTASVSIKVTDSKSNVTTYIYKLTVKAADTTPNTPSNPIALVGTPEGFMESASCANVVGWAWDNGQPNASIALELLDGTTAESATVVATTQANIFRQDLQDAGKGNGAHGFIFSLPASVLNGQPHVLWVRAQGSTYLLNWSGKTITCAPTGGGTTTPPTSSTVTLSDQTATVGQAYSYAVSNIPSGSTVAVSGLPTGLSYNSQANTISGTPTTATTASVNIKVTDSKSNVTTYIYKLTVKAADPTTPTDPTSNIVTMADQTATVGQSYVYVFPNPGAGSKVEVSGLPAGIGFDAMTYGIGGVPTTATVASISIKVTDPKGSVTTYGYKLTVKNADGSSPTTPTTPTSSTVTLSEQTATVGQAYSYAVSNIPSGSSVSVSGLPAGLSYNSQTNTISGTPTTATTASVSIKVTDSKSNTTTYVYKLTVKAAEVPATTSLTLLAPTYDCKTGVITFRTSGGDGTPIEYKAVNVTDWTTNATQVLYLTMREGSTFDILARQSGREIKSTYTTACGGSNENPVDDQTITRGLQYTSTIAEPGAGVRLELSGLPDGISYDGNTRTSSGKPTKAGEYTITLKSFHSNGQSYSINFRLIVKEPQLTIQLIKAGNAASRQVIQTLTDKASISTSSLPDKINIFCSANVPVSSIAFELTGTQQKSYTDNQSPFGVFGDEDGVNPQPGAYLLKVSAFTGVGGSGELISTQTIAFTFTQPSGGRVAATAPSSEDANGVWQVYSNPFREQITLGAPSQQEVSSTSHRFTLVSASGQQWSISGSAVRNDQQTTVIDVQSLQLPAGMYFLQISQDATKPLKAIKLLKE